MFRFFPMLARRNVDEQPFIFSLRLEEAHLM
jgi:hypothetical protein